ncbi:MAG: hypothetical protein Q9163_002921 [Psora crenata]
MAATPAGIRIAQTVGITSAAFMAGNTLCISYLHVPSLLLLPHPLVVRQWKKSFDIGKIVQPGIALISMTAYGYLAYKMKGTLNHHKAELYGLCALSNMFIWPWTMIVMMPTNKKLFQKNYEATAISGSGEIAETGLEKGESSKELINWWATMSIVRGVVPLVGAVLGLWITIN